jgi:hypothetical protein
MSSTKDSFFAKWFYRFWIAALAGVAVTLAGHFGGWKPVLYAGMAIFVLSWIGGIAMIPFGAWAQLKKWFGDETPE